MQAKTDSDIMSSRRLSPATFAQSRTLFFFFNKVLTLLKLCLAELMFSFNSSASSTVCCTSFKNCGQSRLTYRLSGVIG